MQNPLWKNLGASGVRRFTLVLLGLLSCWASGEPLEVLVIGLSHGHVRGFLRHAERDGVRVVAIHERDRALAARYREETGLPADLFHEDLESMLESVPCDAAWVFTDTGSHLKVVEACAPRGIDVIVEKPLANEPWEVDRMEELARWHGIHILTNYETTWYPSMEALYGIAVKDQAVGRITKIEGRFGHRGPAEINVGPEFLSWLTDPQRNGGGASTDFGCYGANLATWLMGNQPPLSVQASFQTHKPELYPEVDDDTVIVLTYPRVQAVIHASWDWHRSVKDLAVYGEKGSVRTLDEDRYRVRLRPRQPAVEHRAEPSGDPSGIAWFAAVLRGEAEPSGSRSALENNAIVVRVLDAARRSAMTGKVVHLSAAAD